jgi:hypothetical protein
VAYRGRTSPSLLDEDVMVTGPVKPSRTSRDSVGKDSDKSNGRTFDEAAGETRARA